MKRYPDLPATTGDLEEKILERWRDEDTFAKSLEQTEGGEPFVFFEGPPTANGRPGIHHVFSRAIKDSVARFRTMQGRYVPRIAGWDTHGLPVEIEAEKRLGISGKPEIERVGIARFNEVCRDSVSTYTEEWERFSARIGYWLDYSRPYVTYRSDYIESVWWSLKRIADEDLIYRGHKILPYCPRCGTGLSSHEVALGYQEVRDPSLYLTMPVLTADGEADGRELLVWTTTPWTLLSNVALAVNPELEYAEVEHEGRRLILAAARVPALLGAEARVTRTFPAKEILGLRYERPFDWVAPPAEPEGAAERGWRVYPAEFVSAEDGTGIVHLAPAFGADDYAVGQEFGLPFLQPVGDRGEFAESLPLVGGRFVKEADDELVQELKRRGRVFRFGREVHSYPHCWRCGSPLLYMARDSWFIRTTAVRDDLIANNNRVHWHPPEVGEGRFGEWIANNVDWALSRNRYWGTPLPAWVCDAEPGHVEFVGSYKELGQRVGGLPEPFDPHRPFIDEYTWACSEPGCTGTMRRTPEVIDVWYDSGSMPFAQWHYPFENKEEAERRYPADFICEGVDQTRGWFYSLMAISTLLGRGPAFRNVVVNDLVLDAEGLKMSKSRGNVVDPWEAIGQYGADSIRWYLLASSHPWLPKRFDPAGVREVQRKVFDTLKSTYHFFQLYANLEGWQPSWKDVAPSERPIMDRWLLSRLSAVTQSVATLMEQYNLTHAVRVLGDFIVDDLSNWYVRRSRDRFWGSADSQDTRAAFATLHRALEDVTRMMAPFAPFLADWLHRALTGGRSAHLSRFPQPDREVRDEALERGMEGVRELSTLGRAARERVKIRVRQPLGALYAVVPDDVEVTPELLEILEDELNVHTVEFMEEAEALVTFSARPNFKALGARLGKRTPKAAEAIRALPSDALAEFRRGQPVRVVVEGEPVELGAEDLEIVQEARGELVVEAEGAYTVALDATITPGLRAEGLARELVNRVQRLRKEADFEVSDRIRLGVAGGAEVVEAAGAHRDFIASETLAVEVEVSAEQPAAGRYEAVREVDLDGVPARIAVARVAREGEGE
ncbi:MAG TPA: isoleucine--tRNA ligase [Longimicrobiaceae bacterium]|nr:isoleucine--tRNA ligase [Longimicrobiaceae bacterium]